MCTKNLLLITLVIITSTNGAKILGIFPYPSKSHAILGTALLKELAFRGHEVTMISPYPLEPSLHNYKNVILTEVVKMKDEKMFGLFSSNASIKTKLNIALNLPGWLYESILNDPNMLNFLESKQNFDIIIMSWGLIDALIGIGYKFDAPTIAFSVMGNSPFINYIFNIPTPYAYVPNIMVGYSDEMTFYQRTLNTLVSFSFDMFNTVITMPLQRKYLKKYFPEAPELDELIENIDLALVCSHFSSETPRPGFPNVIQIGGFHLQEKEELSEEIEIYLNKSTKGVILFSLGTNINSENMPGGVMEIFLKAFKKIKYNILWKIDVEIKNVPENIKIVKWLPQRRVLAHPNLKAFITHGGLASTTEAVYNAVPMIGIPFFSDQFKNMAHCLKKGVGIQLKTSDLTENNITKAINEVIENPFYKKNVEFNSDIYKNQEMNPMDKAVFWVEHVIRHKGGKHLKSRASKLPFYQYYLLDVISFILLIIFCLFFIIWMIFKIVWKCCCKKEKMKIT